MMMSMKIRFAYFILCCMYRGSIGAIPWIVFLVQIAPGVSENCAIVNF